MTDWLHMYNSIHIFIPTFDKLLIWKTKHISALGIYKKVFSA